MARLIQCVPNFSEGRRKEVVENIVDAIASASEAKVIDYSWDVDHNRSVVTFIGAPEAVRASMIAGARAAVELIDLNEHTGGHPRIGAVDVIPVVPLQDVIMADAVALSRDIGQDIAESLGIPVYFYEHSAFDQARANLALIRRGGFEELKNTGLRDGREPDLGPCELHPTAGAVAVGARDPLIAFNVNLATPDIKVARRIATKMRKIRDLGEDLHGVKAIGVYLESRSLAQVSTNITLPQRSGIYDVYAFVEKEAKSMGVDVLESELIGAIREDALLSSTQSALKLRGFTAQRILDHWMRD